MAGGYTPATNPNKRLYNGGSEWQDDIDGLADYYSTFFREYDAVIGRFNGVDPMAAVTDEQSAYVYSGNNPIMKNDPLGDISGGRYSQTDVALFNAILNWNNKYEVERMSTGMQNNYFLWHSTNYTSPWSWDGGIGANGGGSQGRGGSVGGVNARGFTHALISRPSIDFLFYETPEAAARAWGNAFNSSSIEDDKEYGGLIIKYLISGKYYYSFNIPNIGTSKHVNINMFLPQGVEIEAIIHSHAAFKKESDNHFSVYGVEAWNEEGYDSELFYSFKNEWQQPKFDFYLATPMGYLIMWESSKQMLQEIPVFNGLPTKHPDETLTFYNVYEKNSPDKSDEERRNTKPVFIISIDIYGNIGMPRKL